MNNATNTTNLIVTINLADVKQLELISKISALATEVGASVQLGSVSVPTSSVSTPTSEPTEKKVFIHNLPLELDANGYVRLPIRKGWILAKAAKVLMGDDYKMLRTDDYGYFVADKNGKINKSATKKVYDSFENHVLKVQ